MVFGKSKRTYRRISGIYIKKIKAPSYEGFSYALARTKTAGRLPVAPGTHHVQVFAIPVVAYLAAGDLAAEGLAVPVFVPVPVPLSEQFSMQRCDYNISHCTH